MMRFSIALLFVLSGCFLRAADSWNVVGIIDSVHQEELKILVRHEGIKGFAENAGELEVNVSAGDHAIAVEGQKIRGTLTVDGDRLALGSVWPADESVQRTMTLVNRDLTRPKIGQVSKGLLSVGDDMPRFAMYNQKGELITPADWENKLVVLNFIFTRSKVQSMCPATSQRMAELQKRLIDGGHGDSVIFLSLSLDPEYDTPGICFSYLEAIGVDHDSFWLLSGSVKTLDYLRKQIGVVATPSEKTIINHSMVTLIADREGKLFYRKPGSRWNVDDLYGRIGILLNAP
jgi:protein SCO1/2